MPAGDLGGGHQRRRKPQGLVRQRERLVGIGGFRLARLRRQQHGAAAERACRHRHGRCLRAMASVSSAPSQSPARACMSNSALTPQPSLRIALHRLLGERAGRVVVVAALRFEEQAAQAEQLRLGPVEHGLEGAPRRGAVALELRGLGPEQRGQRLARQIAPRDACIALRLAPVADADGEQPARQRIEALRPAPLVHIGGDGGGPREEIAQQAPRRASAARREPRARARRQRRWSRSDSRATRRSWCRAGRRARRARARRR